MDRIKAMPKGGAREGAGRPAFPQGTKRPTIAVSVDPATEELLRSERERTGLSLGAIVDAFADAYRASESQLPGRAIPEEFGG